MLRLTNTSSEPVRVLTRGAEVELLPGESHDLHGYEPTQDSEQTLGPCEELALWPSRDPARPRSPEGWLQSPRADGPGTEPARSSRGRT